MFKSCVGDKNYSKDKSKKFKRIVDSKSKDKKDKKTHLKQSNSSR